METVTDQSFRRSVTVINKEAGFETAHTTLHRWFWNTDAVNINQKKRVDFLIADGTGFKRSKDNEFDTNKGSIKVLIGYSKNGEVIPFGAWTRASWKDIVQKDEAIKISEELNELLYLDLPEVDADPLKSLEDKLKIEIKLKAMKEAIDVFINELHALGYSKAKGFVEKATSQLLPISITG